MDKKGPYIIKELQSLSAGQQVWGKYLILEKKQRKTRDGRDMIDLKLGDSSGEIDSIVWDNCDVSGELESGSVIGLLGDIRVYNNRLQITAKRLKVLEEDASTYLKAPEVSLDTLIENFEYILESIKDIYLKELLNRVFTPEMRKNFFKSPAAKSIHHNYRGGLLEHTLSIAELCSKIAESYTFLNRDLLLAGALLHDIGKTKEYEMKVAPQYTVEGRLLGHIVLGTELITSLIEEMKKEGIDFPEKLEWMLKHMLLSHHGNLEFGSPVIPLFPEAFVLYMMDNLDAKLFVFKNKLEESNQEDEYFTYYDRFFGQYFFKYRYE